MSVDDDTHEKKTLLAARHTFPAGTDWTDSSVTADEFVCRSGRNNGKSKGIRQKRSRRREPDGGLGGDPRVLELRGNG